MKERESKAVDILSKLLRASEETFTDSPPAYSILLIIAQFIADTDTDVQVRNGIIYISDKRAPESVLSFTIPKWNGIETIK